MPLTLSNYYFSHSLFASMIFTTASSSTCMSFQDGRPFLAGIHQEIMKTISTGAFYGTQVAYCSTDSCEQAMVSQYFGDELPIAWEPIELIFG